MRKGQILTSSGSLGSLLKIAETLKESTRDLGGVFTYSDFFNLLPLEPERKIRRILARLISEGVIQKIKRGVYATRNPDLWVLAARLCPSGYVSMDNVLADRGLIGTLAARRVWVCSPLPKKIYRTPVGTVQCLQIKKELMFGFQNQAKAVPVADNEKAFLDLLYFHQRGVRFVVSPYQGIDLHKLNLKKISRYLKAYQDKKLKNLVARIFDGND